MDAIDRTLVVTLGAAMTALAWLAGMNLKLCRDWMRSMDERLSRIEGRDETGR